MKLNKKKLMLAAAALLLILVVSLVSGQGFVDTLLDFAGIGGYEDQTDLPNKPDTGTTDPDNSGSGSGSGQTGTTDKPGSGTESKLDENGKYYSAEDVGRYLYEYGKLPANFITKTEARKLGWEGGSVEKFKPGYAIGGDTFANREGTLPKADGRKYFECDIDTNGSKPRGTKRIVYSNDGLIYYTDDHYETFTLLYGGASK